MRIILGFLLLSFFSCQYVKRKNEGKQNALARVDNEYLYPEDLIGLVPMGTSPKDSAERIKSYVDNWIRKQVVLKQASKSMPINESDIERKLLDYRYSLIAFQFQNDYLKMNPPEPVTDEEVTNYYQTYRDNFTLRQHLIKGKYIKLSAQAPKMEKAKKWFTENDDSNASDLKTYCLRYAGSFYLDNAAWMEFDKLLANTPFMDVPDKVRLLSQKKFVELTDDKFVYWLKIEEYAISNSPAPFEFAKEEIKNILLNKHKVERIKEMENDLYEKAKNNKEFELLVK